MQRNISPLILVLVLWLAGLGAAMQFAKLAVPFEHLRHIYPQAGIGFLISIISLLGIVLGMFAGLLVARIGFRRMLIVGLVLGAGLSFFQATLPPFAVMLASRVLEGASHLMIVVAAPTLIAQISSEKYRPQAMTLWSTFFGVAFAVVAFGGLPLVENYRLPALFIAHGCLLAVTAMALFVLLKALPRTPQVDADFSLGQILREHVKAYSSPSISAPAFGWLFYTLTFVSLLTVLPDLLAQEDREFAAQFMPMMSILASLFCGVILLRYMMAIDVVILGFGLGLVVIQFLWLDIHIVWVCLALLGVLGLVQSASFAAIPQLMGDASSQALANGAMAQLGNLGNTIGTPILLGLIATYGTTGAIWGISLCYVAAIAVHLLMMWRRRREG